MALMDRFASGVDRLAGRFSDMLDQGADQGGAPSFGALVQQGQQQDQGAPSFGGIVRQGLAQGQGAALSFGALAGVPARGLDTSWLTRLGDVRAGIKAAQQNADGTRSTGSTVTATYTGLPTEVAQWADRTNATFGDLGGWVPAAMLAIIEHESSGKPAAYNSAGNAYGLFQQVGLGSSDPDTEFSAAKKLAQQKLASIQDSYAANGLNPDERTRARDLFLAWAGHFDYDTGQPNQASRDIGSGEDWNTYLNGARGIMPMYDNIVKGRQQPGAPAQGQGGTITAGATPWAGATGVTKVAQQWLGLPYVWGGASPQTSFDCSGLTQYAFAQVGTSLPRTAQQQYDATRRVAGNQLQPGDLVFFTGTYETNEAVTHVGIFAGYDSAGHPMMLNAANGGVLYARFDDPYWSAHIYGYGRVPQATGGGGELTP